MDKRDVSGRRYQATYRLTTRPVRFRKTVQNEHTLSTHARLVARRPETDLLTPSPSHSCSLRAYLMRLLLCLLLRPLSPPPFSPHFTLVKRVHDAGAVGFLIRLIHRCFSAPSSSLLLLLLWHVYRLTLSLFLTLSSSLLRFSLRLIPFIVSYVLRQYPFYSLVYVIGPEAYCACRPAS
jgi:hypothetical protein